MGKIRELILKKLEDIYPNYLKLGDERLLKKDYKGAIEFYKKALPIQFKSPYLHYNWATALFAIGSYKEATTRFKRALIIKPDFADAYVHWGLALIHMNQPHPAMHKFKHAARIAPEDPKIYFHWGMLMEQLGKPEFANEKYSKVLELTPVNKNTPDNKFNEYHLMALNQLALYEIKVQNYAEAINKYQRLVELSPDFTPAYYNIAAAAVHLKKNDLAATNLKKAIEQDINVVKRIKQDPIFKNLLGHDILKPLIP